MEQKQPQRWQILIVGSLLILLADFGFFLSIPPQTKIFEDILCRQYYAAHPTHPLEQNCKIAPVQSELARINGWKNTFDALPSILVAVPYGALADRIGRKPCLLLSMFGVLLSEIWTRFICWSSSLRLVWLSGLFRLLGGGDLVVSSIICVMVADVFPENDRATALYRLSSFIILGEILATPVSAAMMTWSSWTPYLLGLAIVALGIPIACFLPETLDRQSIERHTDETQVSLIEQLQQRIRQFSHLTRFLWTGNIILALFMFLTSSLSRQSTSLLLQYSSARYDWSLAHASLFLALRGVVTLFTFALLMPTITAFLARALRMSPTVKDRRMSQASGGLSIIGFVLIAIAAVPSLYVVGLVLLSLGSAFAVTTRSLATALVRPDQIGRLYSATAVVQSIGTLVAGPWFAQLFDVGLQIGWLGLPFLLAGVLFGLATLAVSLVRTYEPANEPEQEPLLSGDA